VPVYRGQSTTPCASPCTTPCTSPCAHARSQASVYGWALTRGCTSAPGLPPHLQRHAELVPDDGVQLFQGRPKEWQPGVQPRVDGHGLLPRARMMCLRWRSSTFDRLVDWLVDCLIHLSICSSVCVRVCVCVRVLAGNALTGAGGAAARMQISA